MQKNRGKQNFLTLTLALTTDFQQTLLLLDQKWKYILKENKQLQATTKLALGHTTQLEQGSPKIHA